MVDTVIIDTSTATPGVVIIEPSSVDINSIGGLSANSVVYDNSSTNLTSTEVQGAIDEIANSVDGLKQQVSGTLFLYVDPDNGDDTNDGLSQGTAWATMARLKQFLDNVFVTASGTIIINLDENTVNDYDNLNLFGSGLAGDGQIFIRGTNDIFKVLTFNTTSTPIQIAFTGNIRIIIRNLNIVATTGTQPNTISVSNVNTLDIDSLVISRGLSVNNSRRVNISSLTFDTIGENRFLNFATIETIFFFFVSYGATGFTRLARCENVFSTFDNITATRSEYIYKFDKCHLVDISSTTLVNSSVTAFRYAEISECSNFNIDTNFSGGTNGVYSGADLPFIDVIDSKNIRINIGSNFTLTGLTTNIAIDGDSQVHTDDLTFSGLPVDGSPSVADGGVLDEFTVTVATGAPVSTPPDGTLYIDNTNSAEKLYARVNNRWIPIGGNSINRETITVDKNLSNIDELYQFIITNTIGLNVNLPVSPIVGTHFIIKNDSSSTENFTTNLVVLTPGEIYEVIYDGVVWQVL